MSMASKCDKKLVKHKLMRRLNQNHYIFVVLESNVNIHVVCSQKHACGAVAVTTSKLNPRNFACIILDDCLFDAQGSEQISCSSHQLYHCCRFKENYIVHSCFVTWSF